MYFYVLKYFFRKNKNCTIIKEKRGMFDISDNDILFELIYTNTHTN
jgi:hypothetical protein